MKSIDWGQARELEVSVEELTLSPDELRASLGYGRAVPSVGVQEIVDRLATQALAVCRPRLGVRIVDGGVDRLCLTLDGVRFSPGAIIASRLRQGTRFAILVASVGPELDGWLHASRSGDDVVVAYVADAIGSVMAEAIVACGMERLGRSMACEGMKITNSYSPGYCGWNVGEQHLLFSLLPDAFCGVRLCESGLMLPIKSVSAVVGIGTDVERRDYGCALCRKQDCYKRRIGI